MGKKTKMRAALGARELTSVWVFAAVALGFAWGATGTDEAPAFALREAVHPELLGTIRSTTCALVATATATIALVFFIVSRRPGPPLPPGCRQLEREGAHVFTFVGLVLLPLGFGMWLQEAGDYADHGWDFARFGAHALESGALLLFGSLAACWGITIDLDVAARQIRISRFLPFPLTARVIPFERIERLRLMSLRDPRDGREIHGLFVELADSRHITVSMAGPAETALRQSQKIAESIGVPFAHDDRRPQT